MPYIPVLEWNSNICTDIRTSAVVGKTNVNLGIAIFLTLFLKTKSEIPGIIVYKIKFLEHGKT